MRLWLLIVFAPCVISMGCQSARSVAQDYSASGQHELAAQYFAQEYLKDRESKEATAELQQALQLAQRDLEADYDAAILAKKTRKALGISIRQEELMRWAYKLRLMGIELEGVSEKSAKARKDALRQAISEVDQAEMKITSPKKLLALLREAVALDPDNVELNDRYARLQQKLKRQISVGIECAPKDREYCDAALKNFLQSVNASRRELFAVANDASNIASAQLILRLQSQHQNGSWQRGPMGRAANKIKKRNDLKEVILNKKGKPVYQKVRAEYATFHRTNKASVTVEVLIKDLRENQPNLFEKRVNKSESDKKSYYTWSGDERALASRSDITRLGTDQSAPVSSRRLARRAWTKLLKELSAEIIDTLEN